MPEGLRLFGGVEVEIDEHKAGFIDRSINPDCEYPALSACIGELIECGPPPAETLGRFTSELLPSWFDDWLMIDREVERESRSRA